MAEPRLTVLYDEDCGLCTWLAAKLGGQGLAAEPIGSAAGERLLRDLPPERRYDSVHVVDAEGRRRSGAESLPMLVRALPALAWAAPLLEALPGPSSWGYELVTRHRRALSRLLGVSK